MPEKIKRSLKRQAEKKGLTGKRKDKYIYGTLHRVAAKRKKG